ncbi:MAG: DUF1573 domain-containing protein [Alistipes sp.]|nr:DUF1573 domain-containing protein [Alistipes sp.]
MKHGCGGLIRLVAIIIFATLPNRISAQIKIVPQQRLIEAGESQTVEQSNMLLTSGDRLDFGTIEELGGAWLGEIEWRNTGSEPIVVTRIHTTCGCLQVTTQDKVVERGGKSRFCVTYHPKGHPGWVRQRAFVYTNLSEQKPTAVLHITGFVTASADHSGNYSYQRGALLLRQERVTFTSGKRAIERIACMNGGTQPLAISANPVFTPQNISLRTEPQRLEAGAEGELVIEYTPSPQDSEGTIKLMLEGLQVPPRERTIEIVINKTE